MAGCVRIAVFGFIALILSVPTLFGQQDVEGSKDYPGITRMPGYYIREYQELQFDSYEFPVTAGRTEKTQVVEGRRINWRYNLKDDVTPPTQLQVVRNYENAARAAGGQVLYSTGDFTTLRFAKGGQETWCAISVANLPSGVFIRMVVIEKQAMQQDVTIDATAMARDLGESGHVTIYGILFDTGKADIKPESASALAEIAKMLKATPALKAYVVGHTDMTADLATNLKLSTARAQAVVNVLTDQHGIAAGRLTPYGAGPYAPVATNKTDEGRAKNRRVELVQIGVQ
jgi:OmpA-OmpF porin, OOP family